MNSLQIINGKKMFESTWKITLLPKQHGTIVIRLYLSKLAIKF